MSNFDSFIEKCPKCGKGSLFVVEVTFTATGEKSHPNASLHADGFVAWPCDMDTKDWSTEDEKVECADCKAAFALSDLLK